MRTYGARVLSTLGWLLIAFAAEAGKLATAPAAVNPRLKMTLNDDWRFLPEDRQEAWNPSQDDSQWQIVNLPHTWNTEDPFDDVPGYRRGQSWYRKHFALDPQLKGKRIFLFFEGVHQKADVFVNGRLAGQHKGGYTAFCLDVTKFLKVPGENLIAVRADSSWQEDIAPLDIGYANYGGIYRDVWLIATDPVHFELTDHASPGVFVDARNVSAAHAELNVRAVLVNDTDKEQRVTIGENLARPAEQSQSGGVGPEKLIPAHGKVDVEMAIPVENPALWSPDNPRLYYLTLTLRGQDHRVLDAFTTHVGIRKFRFDSKEGFFLNDQHLTLRGASRHQDYKGLGSALPNAIHRSDLQWLKDMGANFIRLAHYPQDPEVLDTADRIGLIVWEEIPIVSTMSPSPQFAATQKNVLLDMIRQHYNHPAVVMWGYMNETLLNWSRQPDRDPDFPNQVKKLAAELDALVHKEDATRVTTMAMNLGTSYDNSGISDIPQVAGWNIYMGWYGSTFDKFGAFLDKQHKEHPNRVLFVSEYGAGSDSRLHSLKPRRFDHSVEWQRLYHESHIRQIRQRPYLAGTAIWNEFDFSQPEAGQSIPHTNQKGMLTWDRRPKDVYYLYQANWSDKPVLHIATTEWTYRSGPVEQPVQVYSNLDSVELFLDGKSLGVMKPDDVKSAIWQVAFHDGWNLLEAHAQRGDTEIHDAVRVHFTYYPPKLADTSTPFEEIAVNAGSNCSFTDPQHLIWEPDQEYRPGGWGYVGGVDQWKAIKGESRADILGTTEDPLYQSIREGLEAYRFDVPHGNYELELRFTEYFPKKPGERVFRVSCNGQTLFDHLDLTEQYGVRRAASRTFIVSASAGQGLQVNFDPIAGKTVISALRVRRIK